MLNVDLLNFLTMLFQFNHKMYTYKMLISFTVMSLSKNRQQYYKIPSKKIGTIYSKKKRPNFLIDPCKT